MSVFAILLLLAVVLTVVIIIQRSTGSKPASPSAGEADIVAYLVLALAVGVAGFSLADLATTAFPGDRFVFDPADELATSLSALLVSAPFAIFFWRRQAARRQVHPDAAGWTLYLSLIELVFMTAFLIVAIMFVNGLVSDESISSWPAAVVFAGVLILHEFAVRDTPPLSESGEIPRVLGSALALIAAGIGLGGVLVELMSQLYEAIGGVSVAEGIHPWLAMLIVAAPVWWYRWMRPWPEKMAVPRVTWSVVVTVVSLAVALASVTILAVVGVQYVVAETPPAGQHFEAVPIALALALTAFPIWMLHRRGLGDDATDGVQIYRYAIAALGLGTAVTTVTALTIVALDRDLIVGGSARDIVGLATAALAGLVIWQGFARIASTVDAQRSALPWPRRVYTLGVGIVFSLIGAGALITTIFILLRRLLDADETGSLLEPVSIFIYSGAAGWYLVRTFLRERTEKPAAPVVAPFEVTIICSHPGMIARVFAPEARLRVLYRADDAGPIDEEMAAEIVAAVGNRPSLVWVDQDGFRVAPKRPNT